MDNNISDLLSKEIEKLMENKFFFKTPSNLKILAYSASYILLILLGTLLNIEIIAAFLSVFPLTYVLGAKGLRFYIPLSICGGVILSLVSSLNVIFLFGVHMIIAYIIYKTIYVRASKPFLIVAVTTLLFFSYCVVHFSIDKIR